MSVPGFDSFQAEEAVLSLQRRALAQKGRRVHRLLDAEVDGLEDAAVGTEDAAAGLRRKKQKPAQAIEVCLCSTICVCVCACGVVVLVVWLMWNANI